MKKLLLIICLLLSLASTVANAKTYEEEIKEYHEPQTEAELLVDKVLKLEKTLKRDKCGNTKLTAFVFGDYTNLTKEEIALYGTFFTKEYLREMRWQYEQWGKEQKDQKEIARRKLKQDHMKKSAKIDMTKKNYKLWLKHWEQTKCNIKRSRLLNVVGCNAMHKMGGFLYKTKKGTEICKNCSNVIVFFMPREMQDMSEEDAEKFLGNFGKGFRRVLCYSGIRIKDEGNGYKIDLPHCDRPEDIFNFYKRKG